METASIKTSILFTQEGERLTPESPARDQSSEELMTLLLTFGLDHLDLILYFAGVTTTLTWEQRENIDHGLERITFRPALQ